MNLQQKRNQLKVAEDLFGYCPCQHCKNFHGGLDIYLSLLCPAGSMIESLGRYLKAAPARALNKTLDTHKILHRMPKVALSPGPWAISAKKEPKIPSHNAQIRAFLRSKSHNT